MPDWAKQIALYSATLAAPWAAGSPTSASPGDKPSSMHNFQTSSSHAEELGINAIWFLPLWPMLYGVSDYYTIDHPTARSTT